MPPPTPETIVVTEAQARRLALARALDEEGGAWDAAARERAERDALEAVPAAAHGPDARLYLLARAERLLAIPGAQRPEWLQPAHEPWRTALAWALPLVALACGAVLDRIDNPRQVNLLSPPLLGFLLWNVAVYVLLLAWALRAPASRPHGRAPWWSRLDALPRWAAAPVSRRYLQAWWDAAAPVEGQRWRRLMHTCAAAWGVGVALSIVLGGLVREYRVGWESTLLDLPQVHAFLKVLFAPVVALLPVQPFGMDELARLHFGSGEAAGRLEARRWVFLYLALLAILVVVPRALLAAWAGWRAQRLARALPLRVDDAYYAPVLGRVRPVRVVLRLDAVGGADRQLLRTVLSQATSGAGAPALSTGRGDSLTWTEAGQAPADAVLLAADTAAAAAQWLAGRPVEPVLVVAGAAAARQWSPRLHVPGSDVEYIAASTLCNWTGDAALRAAIARMLPAWQAPGLERLWQAWDSREQARLGRAAAVVAGELAAAAIDTEPVASAPLGVRQLVVRDERDAHEAARVQAAQLLQARLRERRAAADANLLALHGHEGLPPALLAHAGDAPPFQWQQQLHEPQAGLAGAAGGAAIGAAVDLAAGGLTLGAASALGALIGGGAALVAAVWKNRGGAPGVSSLALPADLLDALTREALVRYAVAAQWGRQPASEAAAREAAQAAWRTHGGASDACWRRLREDRDAGQAELAALLQPAMRDTAAALTRRES